MAYSKRRSRQSDTEKLSGIRKKFEDAVDHNNESHSEMHRAGRFYHNTRGEGQWESADISALRDEGRPCYTFNVCREKVDTFLGIYADAQRSPRVVPSGEEDQLTAEVVGIVADQVLEDVHFERKKARTIKTGTVLGECSLQVEVVPDPKRPSWIKIDVHRVMPYELNWDPSSIEADRSDAGYVFWDRWLTRAEFEREYPEHKKQFESLMNKASDPGSDGVSSSTNRAEPVSIHEIDDDYEQDDWNRYYFDRHKSKARVIRYEYKTNVRETYVVDPETDETRVVTAEERRYLEELMEISGRPIEFVQVKSEQVKVCEFIGSTILAEYDSPGPFDGFSISSFVYAMDEEEGVPYGAIRNLFDPQSELNKSKSLEIEMIANGAAGGVTAEIDAIVNEEQFKRERRMPNGVSYVENDALAMNRVREREPYPISPAVIQRAQDAIQLTDRISGLPSSGMVTPASQMEAATTVALRHHKAKQVVQDPIANFEWCVRDTYRKVVESITRSMPDGQIAAVLASEKRFQVQGGIVTEMKQTPQGLQPKGQASLRELHSIDWNIELEMQSENTTLRMMEHEVFMGLQAGGVPVPPDLLAETATGSRSKQERLKTHIEQVQESSSQAAQRESELAQQNMQLMAQLEQMKLQETIRANQAKERLSAEKQESDEQISLLELWEKSDAREKQELLKLASLELEARETMIDARSNGFPA